GPPPRVGRGVGGKGESNKGAPSLLLLAALTEQSRLASDHGPAVVLDPTHLAQAEAADCPQIEARQNDQPQQQQQEGDPVITVEDAQCFLLRLLSRLWIDNDKVGHLPQRAPPAE